MALREFSAALICALLCSCATPIARDLGEQEANAVVVALERGGVAAEKLPAAEGEGQWDVSVARGEASSAVQLLLAADLPAADVPGVLDALGNESLVPSRTAEHARLIAGTAGDLERSLRAVGGVLSARVHLAVPAPAPFELGEAAVPASGSVLIRHTGATLPIAAEDVRRLVSGAVPGLAPERVSVVSSPVPAADRAPGRRLARLGPISLPRSALSALRAVGLAVVAAMLILASLCMLLWHRLKRTQAQLASARSELEASSS